MARHGSFVVLLVAAFAGSAGSAEPAPTPLWDALARGEVCAVASSVSGASVVELSLSNVTSSDITVDVNGALILPVKNTQPVRPATRIRTAVLPPFTQTQPLGVGLVQGNGGETRVTVMPGTARTVRLLTLCLNHGVPSPDTSTPLSVARTPAPPAALAVLKSWRAHPDLDQGQVQGDVWSKAAPLARFELDTDVARVAACAAPGDLRTCERSVERTALPEGTSRVLVVAGEIATLTSAGGLSIARYGEGFRCIATDVLGAAADRNSLYALLPEAPVSHASAVVRYDLENERWAEELGTGGTDLLWARPGAAIVARGGKLVLVEPEKERVLTGSSAARVVDQGNMAYVLAPGEGDGETRVVRLERTYRGVEVSRQIVNARLGSACCMGGNLYAADETGAIVRVRSSGTWVALSVPDDIGQRGEREAVQRVAATSAGLLIVTDKRVVAWSPGCTAFDVATDPTAGFARDATTGELHAIIGRSLYRYESSRRGWDPVRVDVR